MGRIVDRKYLSVEITGSVPIQLTGTLPGICVKGLRYENIVSASLPPAASGSLTTYEITEKSVFYKMILDVDSDNIYIQVEVDNQNIFPGTDGFNLEDLEDLDLGGGSDYEESSVKFDIYQYDKNKWIWIPPEPVCVTSNMKIKMKSSDENNDRNLDNGIAVRRIL